MTKQPIDALRDAAGRIDIIGENTGDIRDLYALGDRLLSIHDHAIVEIQLADQIDPERTNPAIASTYQHVLAAGASDDDVVRTLLQARRLFQRHFMPEGIDVVRAQEIVFDGLLDLVAMREISNAVETQTGAALQRFANAKGKQGLPSLPNLKAQCEMFMQKAKHVTASMRALSGLFYPEAIKKKDWPLAISETALAATQEATDEDVQFWDQWALFLGFVANARNAMEHRDNLKRFVVRPFLLSPENVVVPPMIEVVHPKHPHPAVPAKEFLAAVTDGLRDSCEALIVELATIHLIDRGGCEVRVDFIPEDARGNRPERYAFIGKLPDGGWSVFL